MTQSSAEGGGYQASLRRTPGASAYLLINFVIAMVSLSVLAALFFTGVGTLVVIIGVPIIVLSLVVARGFGTLERTMLAWTGLPAIAEPDWPQPPPGADLITRLFTRLRSGHYWSYLLHQMLIGPILSTVTFSLAITWWTGALAGPTFWAWQVFLPDRDPSSDWPAWLADRVPLLHGLPSRLVESGIYLVLGLVFAITLPPVISGLARLRHAIAALMLGRWRSDDLRALASEEAAGRKSAVHAEDTAMRRLERDLHDGPQQRLIRLQMDLAATERRARAGEADQAADYARQAQAQAQAALAELRALSRGVAPPLLADRGLRSALESLAEESPLTVRTHLDPALDEAVTPEIGRALYFVVAELLTNAVRHAGATTVEVTAEVRHGDPARVRIVVIDDGRGGAEFVSGRGLAGLRERVQGLLGTLTLESPPGGATRVDVTVPTPSTGYGQPYSEA